MLRALLLALVIASPALARDPVLMQPLICTLGEDCFILNYVDADPVPGAADFTCGPRSYDGHQGTDFAVLSFDAMRAGVPVRPVSPGVVTHLRDGMPDAGMSGTPSELLANRDCGNGVLIDHGGDPNENVWLHHAILRGRSLEHIRLLFEAGGDIRAENREGVSVFRWAMLHGREDVVTWLRGLGVEERPSDEERFVAACTRGDEAAARSILADHPDMLSRLSKPQLRMLPQLAGIGAIDAVRTMLAVGWPREVKAGWHATALNHAVFQGDAAMTRLIMQAGADWRTQHGFGDNVLGTLSFASNAEDIADPAPLDYVGCAEALVEGGVPVEAFDDYVFSSEVAAWLETA